MSKPQTEAGLDLLESEMWDRLLLVLGGMASSEEDLNVAILAIEQEAIAAHRMRLLDQLDRLPTATVATSDSPAIRMPGLVSREAVRALLSDPKP